MSVTKLDSEDNTPIAGAVFGLYADEDIKNVDGKVIIEKGTLLEKTTSDENGKIACISICLKCCVSINRDVDILAS